MGPAIGSKYGNVRGKGRQMEREGLEGADKGKGNQGPVKVIPG